MHGVRLADVPLLAPQPAYLRSYAVNMVQDTDTVWQLNLSTCPHVNFTTMLLKSENDGT
jgi:hypothetical protein